MLKMYPEETPLKGEESSTTFRIGGNKLLFISLGCPRNRVDTEVMLGILLKAGYEPTDALEEADYIIINTCGFLETAREESLATIGEVHDERKEGAKIIVTGCMVQTHNHEIKKHFPDIDYLLGSGDVEGILRAIQSKTQGSAITSARSYLEAGEVPRQISTPSHYAYLKIAEGCKKRCAYCVIPQIKGPLRSKSLEQIVKEFRTLRAQGVHEIILIAQDLGDWGKDQGYKRSDGLIKVLETLLKEEGDFWLRLLYLYPDEITHSLIKLMKSDPRICPYLDMPIQHVNNRVLKSMHRATSREAIVQTLELLRLEIPEVTIRTSLIVGFPGETEKEFEELVTFVKEHPIDNVGIFQYSQEEGSHAWALPDQIPDEVKVKRQKRLAKVQKKVVQQLLKKKIGKTLEVVIEGYHPDSPYLLRGRHRGQCPEIDGEVIINDPTGVDAFGKRYQVKITDVIDYDLVGSTCSKIIDHR
ncbi:MAG: 30S ribosomal protein S12 methylthiotransferase RimO [Chlamydiia bacterium]|nr:30S ribosomal protein S12 methylthiotransferase RimO [Chlamydiia bacterium]